MSSGDMDNYSESSTPPNSKRPPIQIESVERNARAVIHALALESPEKDDRAGDLFDAMEAAASPSPLRTKLQRRRSSEKDFMDVVTAAEPQGGDAELNAALDALDTVQQFAAHKAGAAPQEQEEYLAATTPGQRLAQFLKEQLLHREQARRQAEHNAKAASQALATRDARLAATEAKCREYKQQALHATTKSQRLEARVADLQAKIAAAERSAHSSMEAAQRKDAEIEAVRRNAAAQVEKAQQRLAELEMKLHLSGNASVANRSGAVEGAFPASPLSDVFATPPGKCTQSHIPRGADQKAAGRDMAALGDSDDDIIFEAAAAVREVAKEIAQKVHKENKNVSNDVRAVQIARKKVQADEERLLRSEIATLERKCERADHMLVKANHAMRVLHHKLQKERQTAAALQEEKCLLQSQLLAAQERPQGIDPEQLGALLQELAQCRARVETLAEERATLFARLEATENQLTATDKERAEERVAAEQEATERLEEARSRGELLESRVEDLVKQLKTAAAAASQLDITSQALQEAQSRCGELAAELEAERAVSSVRANELAKLAEIAQSFATELMAAREDAQEHRGAYEKIVHENAGLQGRVEALTEALSRLERSDDMLETLAESQADLQGRLRQAESTANGARVAADTARADLQAQNELTAELERTIDVLKSELSAAEEHNQTLQAAAEAAAKQLAELTESHEELQSELENAAEEAGMTRSDAAELAQRVMAAEARAHEAQQLAAHLQSALETSEARESALSTEIQDLKSAAQDAALEAARLRATMAEIQQERDECRGKIDRLDATIVALNAECDALRYASATAEGTSQVLVDNMCDMTGLIDAVAALQQQNRLLEEECSATATRANRAESERDTTALERAALERELGNERERLSAAQAAHEILQHGHEALRADYAVATRQLEVVEEAHAELKTEHAALQQRELELRAAAASAAAEGQRLQEEVQRLNTAVTEAQSQASAAQAEIKELLGQKEEWMRFESALREQIAAAEKAKGLAEGKLVLAKQRESKLKEAAVQLQQLQSELEAYVQESEALRQEKEAAEDRCAELTGRCMVLLDQMNVLEEQVATACADAATQNAQQEALREELRGVLTQVAALQDQLAEMAPLPTRLAELESEREETSAWCDDMSTQLATRGEELAAVQSELETSSQRCETLERELAATTERALAAEGAAADAESSRLALAAALASAEQALEVYDTDLKSAKEKHAQTVEELREAEEERDAALERAAEISEALVNLEEDHDALEAVLQSAQAAHKAVEEALHRRLAELEASSAESAGQAAALDEARRRQIEELQSAVQAGSAACTSLAAKVESAAKARQEALDECALLHIETDELQAALAEAESKIECTAAALAQANADKEELAGTSANYARDAELLEVQIGVLKGQIEFLQSVRSKDADASDSIRRQLGASYQELGSLRERLASAEDALQQARQENEAACRQVADAQEAAAAAQVQAQRMQSAVDAAAAEARASHAAKTEAEHRVSALEQQLELSEVLKDQGQRELEVAREAAAEARLEAQHAQQVAGEAERRRLAALSESELVLRNANSRMASQMTVMEKIEAAVGRLASADGSAASLAQVAAQLEAIIADSSGENSDDSSNSQVASQKRALLLKLGQVQRGVARLAGKKAAEEKAALAATAAGNEREAVWKAEKSILSGLCRLAVALTMDQVDGKGAAPAVAAELDAIVAVHGSTLKSLGFQGVWSSLRSLADTSTCLYNRRRAAEEKAQRLHQEVSALQSRCLALEREALQERRRSETFENALSTEAERVRGMAGSVRWATGDFGPEEVVGGDNSAPTEHLTACVNALGVVLQRLIRRYRTISRQVGPSMSQKWESKAALSAAGEGGSGGDGDLKIPAHPGKTAMSQIDDDVPLRTRYATPPLSPLK